MYKDDRVTLHVKSNSDYKTKNHSGHFEIDNGGDKQVLQRGKERGAWGRSRFDNVNYHLHHREGKHT